MRIIHTADWQIGKPFKQFGDQEGVLRQARLSAIEKIGQLAERENVEHVLVAGDIYDTEAPAPKTLLEPIERMRRFPNVQWDLISGNHDPHRPKGVWDRVREAGTPQNVHLHLTAAPFALGPAAVLLPAPLTRKSEGRDLTEWMDRAETAPGVIRIGLAHGSVVGFGTGGEANNPIDPRRPERAGLSYLALGDWHRTIQVGPSVWYAGTPEPDRAGSQEHGQALVIDIPGPGAPASVTTQVVGTYHWLTQEEHLADSSELEDLETRLRALPEPSCTILRLFLRGTLPIAGRAELDRRLVGLAAALFHLNVDQSALLVRPTSADLEAIDFGGVLRHAADRLKTMADDESMDANERRRAEDALVQLFVMAVGNSGQEAS
jgi:DNA repair exonuclease SbcCD nuclease subunit